MVDMPTFLAAPYSIGGKSPNWGCRFYPIEVDGLNCLLSSFCGTGLIMLKSFRSLIDLAIRCCLGAKPSKFVSIVCMNKVR